MRKFLQPRLWLQRSFGIDACNKRRGHQIIVPLIRQTLVPDYYRRTEGASSVESQNRRTAEREGTVEGREAALEGRKGALAGRYEEPEEALYGCGYRYANEKARLADENARITLELAETRTRRDVLSVHNDALSNKLSEARTKVRDSEELTEKL